MVREQEELGWGETGKEQYRRQKSEEKDKGTDEE